MNSRLVKFSQMISRLNIILTVADNHLSYPFEDYGKHEEIRPICPPKHSRPWHPWRSRTDFDAAALALDCHMNESQTNKLVELLRRVAYGLDNFTLKNYDEIQTTWDWAAERSTNVSVTEFIWYERIEHFISSRGRTFLYLTVTKKNLLNCTIVLFGSGCKSFCPIRMLYHKCNGMHAVNTGLMVRQRHGNALYKKPGQQTSGGQFRYCFWCSMYS